MSLRAADAQTGVSHSTINNMLSGKANIQPLNLVKFAKGFGESPAHWLELCGYDGTWDEPTVDDPDAQEILQAFLRLPSEVRPRIKEHIVGILSLVA